MSIPTPQSCNAVPGKTTQVTNTLQWLPENTEYPPCAAAYAPLINGDKAFGAVAKAIKQAKKSIDIITWGFQPSMYLERPGGKCIGDLLREAATERNVIVRILVWFSRTGQMVEANFPGWEAYLPEERNQHDYPFQSQAELFKKNLQRIEKNNVKLMATGDRLGYEDPSQYEFDKYWHYLVANGGIPNITVRRRKIGWIADATTIKARLGELPYPVKDDSSMMRSMALKLGATHHQKMVLVDYEDPDNAVGFMMGHNMLSQYWDTDDHSCLPKKYDAGRDGPTGWQDISGCVYGEVLKHMNENFVQSWEKDVGDSTPKTERAAIAKEVFAPTTARLAALNERLALPVPLKTTMGMVCRTQPQYKKYDILKAYMEGVKRARQYIYIENQYFRFQEIAENIKKAAVELIACGRDPDKYGYLYLFVVTNSTEKPTNQNYPSNEVGGYQTYKMLDALGRADRVPVYAKKEKGATEPIKPQNIPGLKTQICTLVSPNSLADNWVPVYVHSKMMMVDDTLLVQGSANINLRSMAFDSEIAIALQDTDVSSIIPQMRNELWKIHTGGQGIGNDPKKTFENWSKLINSNKTQKMVKGKPVIPLIEFHDGSSKLKNTD